MSEYMSQNKTHPIRWFPSHRDNNACYHVMKPHVNDIISFKLVAFPLMAWLRHVAIYNGVSIGSGDNGLLPIGTKPIHEPMLTY